MTEEEASQKRCTPMVFVLVVPRDVRDGMAAAGAQTGTSCIGSKCALWCWFDYANEKGKTYFPKGEALERANFHKGKRNPGKEVECEERAARGYCGLTGSRE